MGDKQVFKRKILIDAPIKKDLFDGKGHHKTALALADAISEFEFEDRAIGLEGAWGSGKSSVVEMAESLLDKRNKGSSARFSFFTFDIWKSQGTAFRRTFLEHLVSWSLREFPKKRANLELIEKKVKGKTKHLTTDNNPMLDWYGVAVLVVLPFLPIFYFWAKKVFDETEEGFLKSNPMWCLYLFLGATLLRAIHKYAFGDDKDPSFRSSLSRTLLISAKQYESQEVTQHIREVDPNDFEFQETLTEILATIQGPKNKIVLVLDNIDRIPKEDLDDYWSAVRSIFTKSSTSSNVKKNSEITAIVPYDRAHILPKNAFDDDGNLDNEGIFVRRELLSKTFDEILHVAAPVMSNSRAFFESKIAEALPNYNDADELFRCYLIFNSHFGARSKQFTPRQIIAFINELTGLFGMHVGTYDLTTVAVFICFREAIEDDPYVLTSSDFLDEKIRRLAPDAQLEENLAALLYNVDSNLALELLLDSRILNAAEDSSAEELVTLSRSKGFELRVGEVIADSQRSWASSGELGQVIRNFAMLFEEYDGDARSQIIEGLCLSLRGVKEIALVQEQYADYLTLVNYCGEEKVSSVLRTILVKALNSITTEGPADFEIGRNWVSFLRDIREMFAPDEGLPMVASALATVSLPSIPDFLLGCAYGCHEHAIPLKTHGTISMPVPKSDSDENPLVDFADENSDLAFEVFSELLEANAVKNPQWLLVGQKIIANLQVAETHEVRQFSSLLKMLVLLTNKAPESVRNSLDIEPIIGSSVFFDGFGKVFTENDGDEGVAHALFLARTKLNGEQLPALKGIAGAPPTATAKAGYERFKQIYDGELELSDEQLSVVAANAKDRSAVTKWIIDGDQYTSHALIDGVVRKAFETLPLPFIGFSTLLGYFDFLDRVLDNDFGEVIVGLQHRYKTEDHSKTKLKDVPLGALTKIRSVTDEGYRDLFDLVEKELQSIGGDEWTSCLAASSHEVALLVEYSNIAEISMPDAEFRASFQSFVSDVLDETTDISSSTVSFDVVFQTIPKSFHSDLFRKCRESVRSVTANGLQNAMRMMPNVVVGIVTDGDRVMASEKESIVRHFLCTALDAKDRQLLSAFVKLGRKRVADFIKHSEDATRDLLTGSMENFAKQEEDREFSRKVSDVVIGAKRTRIVWNGLFPSYESVSVEDDDPAE
ncbi:KAP family NTPase [Rhodobacteraceae bacterium S2214]|nr:KAP family NTPase [Rhodobacteraceae bacterium S2214]